MTTTQLVILLAAGALGAIVKATVGMGLPLVVVPIATLFMPQPMVVAALAAPNFVQNVALSWQNRHVSSEVNHLGAFIGAGLVGALIGAAAVPHTPEWLLKLLLVVIVAVFLWTSAPSTRTLSVRPDGKLRIPVGMTAGFFQGSVGIAGPIVAPWFQARGLGRDAFVFAISTTFAFASSMQVGVYLFQGRLTHLWTASVGLLLIVLTAGPIGRRLRHRLDPEQFRRAVFALVFITWLLLVVDLGERAVVAAM